MGFPNLSHIFFLQKQPPGNNEKEVLFPAGTQFQVLRHTEAGMKELLQSVMRCTQPDLPGLQP